MRIEDQLKPEESSSPSDEARERLKAALAKIQKRLSAIEGFLSSKFPPRDRAALIDPVFRALSEDLIRTFEECDRLIDEAPHAAAHLPQLHAFWEETVLKRFETDYPNLKGVVESETVPGDSQHRLDFSRREKKVLDSFFLFVGLPGCPNSTCLPHVPIELQGSGRRLLPAAQGPPRLQETRLGFRGDRKLTRSSPSGSRSSSTTS